MPRFPNLQNLAPLVVEEVQIEDLVPFENLGPNLHQNLDGGPANINLGMVHTFLITLTPVNFSTSTSLITFFNLFGNSSKLQIQASFRVSWNTRSNILLNSVWAQSYMTTTSGLLLSNIIVGPPCSISRALIQAQKQLDFGPNSSEELTRLSPMS